MDRKLHANGAYMANINSPSTASTSNASKPSSGDQRESAPPDKPAPGASGDDKPVAPAGDAGLFDVDPDQDDVSQDSETVVTGDVDSFPLDEEP